MAATILLAAGAWGGQAQAQPRQVVTTCGTQALVVGDGNNGYIDATGLQCGKAATVPTVTTWQATMTLTAATSTSLIDANVTKVPNSAATPASFTLLTVVNPGAGDVNVCEFGGTCSASVGEILKAGGGGDTFNISPASVPTFFSTNGTTLTLRNGN